MCYKPIKQIVGLTGPARDFVFVNKLVCSKVKITSEFSNVGILGWWDFYIREFGRHPLYLR